MDLYLYALNLGGMSRLLLASWRKILPNLMVSIQFSFYLSSVEGKILKLSLKWPPLCVHMLHDSWDNECNRFYSHAQVILYDTVDFKKGRLFRVCLT